MLQFSSGFCSNLVKNHISRCNYHTHIELRKSFYEFFKSKNHTTLQSSSVLPDDNDTTLLFKNSGVCQFKQQILSGTDSRRIANIQKCIRASGKHNDLDDVGKDLHHQTFFEMMGNWSINNAFSKEEACRFAWEYLTEVLRIDADRLYVSYYGGTNHTNLPDSADLECREIWRKIGVPEGRILPFVTENFWEMGGVGPCGPCTEIHYDRIGGRDASRLVNIDDSVVEIWNLVFMDSFKNSSGIIKKLDRKHIDTGMGFERLLSVVQGKNSNFDTDVFSPIIQKISELSGRSYGGTITNREDAVFRLIADHIRAATIAISDGATPEGVGAGFIVRKMMRRAFLQGATRLSIDRYALADLVPTIAGIFKDVYPEIEVEKVGKIILEDEQKFWKTVDKGKRMFDMIAKSTESTIISGKQAFDLFETHGLPLSVTVELARDVGKEVDEKMFESCKLKAQEMSKKASLFKQPISAGDFPTHSDDVKYSYKLVANGNAYEFPTISTKVLGLFHNQEPVEMLQEGQDGSVILETCQFYAEQGGQLSDFGVVSIDNQVRLNVQSAKKVDGITVLYGKALGILEKGAKATTRLDEARRSGLMRAHSATHLLNWALQKSRLGGGQKGSSVDCDFLRFDYSTGSSMEKEQRLELLLQCENIMNEFIQKGGATKIEETTMEEAKKIENLQSDLKEDRIGGKTIRVVTLGAGKDVPVECCSGTHVLDVKSIGRVAFISDKSIGTGVRRIFAVTGEEEEKCQKYLKATKESLEKTEGKEWKILVKNLDWKKIPLTSQAEISAIIAARKKEMKQKKGK